MGEGEGWNVGERRGGDREGGRDSHVEDMGIITL